MKESEKYNALLLELAEVISNKNSEIELLKWQIYNLETELKKAEEAEKHEPERMGA